MEGCRVGSREKLRRWSEGGTEATELRSGMEGAVELGWS